MYAVATIVEYLYARWHQRVISFEPRGNMADWLVSATQLLPGMDGKISTERQLTRHTS